MRRWYPALTDGARAKIAAFQKEKQFEPTGFLDEPTFLKLLDQPFEARHFEVEEHYSSEKPVKFGEWVMQPTADNCQLWSVPVAVKGRFVPEFNRLPKLDLTRWRDYKDDNLIQTYAAKELYLPLAEVQLTAGRRFEVRDSSGDYRPVEICTKSGCSGNEAIKAWAKLPSFQVIGPSKFGGELVLTYSTKGFVEAFRHMDKECANGQLGRLLQ